MSLTTSLAAAGDWPTATPAEAGFDPALGEALEDAHAAGRLDNIHGVLVIRGGKLLLERYFEGEDERWGRPLGRIAFGPDELHDVRSVTKSIVGLLYGIALADGRVPALDRPLVEQFPYDDLASDPRRRRITVENALTMQLGLEWDEGLSYADPRNSEHAMELAEDRYRFVLDRPIVAEPGGQWVYNGGATALLGKLVAEGSGLSLVDYAEEKLFRPLGITESDWVIGHDGEPIAASGLRLRPRDLAKVGQLILNKGLWEGRQLVPADWLERSFEHHADVDEQIDYGYQWWLGRFPRSGKTWIGAFGNGGQRLFVAPILDLAVVVTAGNYNEKDAWQLPVKVITEIVLPALRDG